MEVIAVVDIPVRREHHLELAARSIARHAPQLVASWYARAARQGAELAVKVARDDEPSAVALAKAGHVHCERGAVLLAEVLRRAAELGLRAVGRRPLELDDVARCQRCREV